MCIKLLGQCVAVASGYGVSITATVLTAVGGVEWGPCLAVEGAVQALGNGVLGENIGVEEGAGRVGSVGVGMAAVVASLGVASSGADAGIISLTLGKGEVPMP